MRPASVHLAAAAVLFATASAATAAPARAPLGDVQPRLGDVQPCLGDVQPRLGELSGGVQDAAAIAFDQWLAAANSLRDAGEQLAGWSRVGSGFLGGIERAAAYFHVQLRHALVAGERWLAALAEQAVAAQVPDLTVLLTEPVKGVESSGYGWRADPINRSKRFHKGADYRADRGTPVYAAGPGVVVFTGRQHGYGKVIYLDHGGGLITRYAHLNEVGVAKGDTVASDDLIGEVGSSGRTTGPHLHFEVRIDGRAVDPVLAMQIANLQRTEPPAIARLAAMALVPEVQTQSIDRHDPPRSHRHRRNRPERSGRHGSRRDRPTS